MSETPNPFPPNEPRYKSVEEAAKIYLLPNLFTAGHLLCVGVRLARFNVITNPLVPGSDKRKSTGEFMGLPSPAGAGMTASIVLLLTTGNAEVLALKPLLLPLMLLISFIMISNIPYPS